MKRCFITKFQQTRLLNFRHSNLDSYYIFLPCVPTNLTSNRQFQFQRPKNEINEFFINISYWYIFICYLLLLTWFDID